MAAGFSAEQPADSSDLQRTNSLIEQVVEGFAEAEDAECSADWTLESAGLRDEPIAGSFAGWIVEKTAGQTVDSLPELNDHSHPEPSDNSLPEQTVDHSLEPKEAMELTYKRTDSIGQLHVEQTFEQMPVSTPQLAADWTLLVVVVAAHRSPVHTEWQVPWWEERREEKRRKRQEQLPHSDKPRDGRSDCPPSSARHAQPDGTEQTVSYRRDSASLSLQSTGTGTDALPSDPLEWCCGRKRTERRWRCMNTFFNPYPYAPYIPKPHLNPSDTGPIPFAQSDGRKFA